jgi:hypothetical protein
MLNWLFRKNIKRKNILYITIDGIAFNPRQLDAIIKNLKDRNATLEASNKALKRHLYAVQQENRCYEETAWKPVHVNYS